MSKELTERQRRFADEYIISGNVTQAAIKAGYTETYADRQAYKLLGNIGIAKRIEERNKLIESDKIADMEEVKEFWTNTLRDEDNDYKDRLKASEFIAKTNGAFIDKQDINTTGDIGIKVEWSE